ncbi:MAG: hypothetical protein L0Y72_05415 [Gemmataceae bacterium]|nr:hypothetical protein [Gemmataceae bacterium]
MQRRIWKHLDRPDFGLAHKLSEKIASRELLTPDFLTDVCSSRELLVACDFGGSNKESRYESYAFLVGAISGSGHWDEQRKAVRATYLRDNRRMSYKRLGDALRARCLVPFLNAANTLPGLLVTFLIDRSIPRLVGDEGLLRFFPEFVVAERGWNHNSFHRLCVVASIGALLVSGLSAETQDILWVSDQDEIAPNPKKHNHAGHVIHHHITRYAPKNHGLFVFVTTEADLNARRIEDVVAIPDLVAGALAEVLSQAQLAGRGAGTPLWIPVPDGVPQKARLILKWFGAQSFPLRRLAIVLDADSSGEVNAEVFSISQAPTSVLLRANSSGLLENLILN